MQPTNGHGESPGEALRGGLSQLGEVREYLTYYLAAKADGVKVSLRNLAVYAVLGILGMAVGVAVLATTGVLLLVGIAQGLGRLFGGREWLGDIVVAVVILGTVAGGAFFGLRWLTNTSRKKLVSKYEDRQRKQRYEYGHDIAERAAAAAREQSVSGKSVAAPQHESAHTGGRN
jgi:hypothetical protein